MRNIVVCHPCSFAPGGEPLWFVVKKDNSQIQCNAPNLKCSFVKVLFANASVTRSTRLPNAIILSAFIGRGILSCCRVCSLGGRQGEMEAQTRGSGTRTYSQPRQSFLVSSVPGGLLTDIGRCRGRSRCSRKRQSVR